MSPKKSPPSLSQVIVKACQAKKGLDVQLLDLSQISSYAEQVIVVSTTSDRHAQTIADHILDQAHKTLALSPIGVEGYETGQWVLVDFGSVVCHVFCNELRYEYHLEDMWPSVSPVLEDALPAFFKPKIKIKTKASPKTATKTKTTKTVAKKRARSNASK
ncbi:MAG: hypothetical protein ACD_62C00247G0008 [uncultured bacterium]|nr:MAG: hypothetical protein ACD_62C00247G0008 [uncultured bacterium]HLD44792.1 ribosome silencing factor [bacterium]